MTMLEPDRARGWHLNSTAKVAVMSFAAAVCVIAFLSAFPAFDLAVAKTFYLGGGLFAGKQFLVVDVIRHTFSALFAAACLAAFIGLVLTRDRVRTWCNLGFTNWLFLAVCLAMGPGVVVNLGLKDHWGRARPSQTVEFGGHKLFTPALQPADQCDRNCSFVSGEASAMFALFFASAVLYRRKATALIGAGIAAGMAAGLVRMSQGAHFLTDVISAGLLMGVIVLTVHLLFEAIAPDPHSATAALPFGETPA